MRMLSLRLEQKYAKRWLSLRIVTYLIEYLSEFEFIFETVLGYVSGGQMDSFEAKKPKLKISCLGTFKTADEIGPSLTKKQPKKMFNSPTWGCHVLKRD